MKPQRILIVDDKEDNLYLLRTLLEGHQYAVDEAHHGAEALCCARQHPPDLIIADILMPVMDGFALCREWRRDPQLKSIPFVFYTATYTDSRDRTFALSLGADRFIIKPEETENLLAVLREVLDAAASSPPAAGHPTTGARADLASANAADPDSVYLKQYNEALIRKLESKMEELEQANRTLRENLAERERMSEVIKESEERYRQLFAALQDAFLIAAPDGQVYSANQAACHMFGRSEDEIKHIGRNGLVDPADSRYFTALAEREHNDHFHGELYGLRADGTKFPAEVSSVLIRRQKNDHRVGIIVRDLTERKRAEAEIQEQFSELRRWHQAMLGRESRILELKQEVNDALAKAGRSPRYESAAATLVG